MRERQYSILLYTILLLLMVIMGFATRGKIFFPDSLQSTAFQIPFLGILTLAQMVAMITGGIDLSIISNVNLSGIVGAMLMKNGYPVWMAILSSMAVATAVGSLNGVLVSSISMPPIIATLGTMILIKGVSLILTKGYVIAGFPDEFVFIGNGTVLGVPVPFLIFLGVLIYVSIVLRRTTFGITLYMMGSNPVATEFSGVSVKRSLFKTYLMVGVLSGVASIVMVSRFNAAQAGYGESYLLLTVLACVLGGVDPAGGSGKVLDLFVAITVLQFVATGFNLMRLSAHLSNALWGIILILVITLTRFLRRKTS